MEKFIPKRKCIVCNKIKEKQQLFKIVKNKDNEILFDKNNKLNGKGAYICKSGDCIELLSKKSALCRAFKGKVSVEIHNRISEELKKYE